MKLSIVNILIVFGLKLSANNVAADAKTGSCISDETFEETDPTVGRYTCARIALEKAAAGGVFNCEQSVFLDNFIEPCPVECGTCAACADSDDDITGFKDGDKKCTFISGKKKKKIKKYCRKNKNVLEACPLTCDNCDSNAPTDSYVCEDTSFEFTYTAVVDPTTVPFTCESLDDQYNAGAIDTACEEEEIKVKCPVLCDNCNSASPSVVSSAPSSKPSVSSTTCVDKKVRGTKIEYTRGTVDADGITTFPVTDPKKVRKNKKCKQLAKESTKTIVNACEKGQVNVAGALGAAGGIDDYCKLTCDSCGISAAPSISVIEPECADDNNAKFFVNHSSGTDKGCTWLRNNPAEIAKCCEEGQGGYLNCKKTCSRCN